MTLADAIAAAMFQTRMLPGVKQAPDHAPEDVNEFPQVFCYPDSMDYTVKMHKGRGGAPVWGAAYGLTFVWVDAVYSEPENIRRATLALDELALLLIGEANRNQWNNTIYSLDSVSLLDFGYVEGDKSPRSFVAGLSVAITIWHNNARGLRDTATGG